jgi:hypothetical protein
MADQKNQYMYSHKELAVILLKHEKIHEGLYDTSYEFQVAVGTLGPQASEVLPGAMLGISRAGITKVDKSGPHTVDAAEVNPRPKARARKS